MWGCRLVGPCIGASGVGPRQAVCVSPRAYVDQNLIHLGICVIIIVYHGWACHLCGIFAHVIRTASVAERCATFQGHPVCHSKHGQNAALVTSRWCSECQGGLPRMAITVSRRGDLYRTPPHLQYVPHLRLL